MSNGENVDYAPKQDYPKKYHTKEDRLGELENKIGYIETDINRVKARMVTWGELIAFIAVVLLLLLWGDKVWECIKSIAVPVASGLRRFFRLFGR